MVPKQAYLVSIYHVAILIGAVLIVVLLQLEILHPTEDIRLMIYAITFGCSGGALTVSRTVVHAVRRDDYKNKFLLWQLLTPIHSGFLAYIGLVLLKGGLLFLTDNQTQLQTLGPRYSWSIMGFSFFVGFFSEVFIKRLRAAAEALFGERSDKDGNEQQEK